MKKAVVIYWSAAGTTKKSAEHINEGLVQGGYESSLLNLKDKTDIDFYAYDLVCLGMPSYNWHPPKPVVDLLKAKLDEYKSLGKVKMGAPKLTGKNALVFCTYSGPHTGIREAEPVGKYVGQFFEHFGFTVVDEWYILSEFAGNEEHNTLGRMGNIKGLPSKKDLLRIKDMAYNLAQRL